MNISIFNLVLQQTLRDAREIYNLAKSNNWEDTQEYINYQDELNALSVKYSKTDEVEEKTKVDKQKK